MKRLIPAVGLAVALTACIPPKILPVWREIACRATTDVTVPERCMWWRDADGSIIHGPYWQFKVLQRYGAVEIPAP